MQSQSRRHFVLRAGALAATAWSLPALAQSTRQATRLVVGFPPGGPADVLARALAVSLKDSLGMPVIVENRPGAGGRIAADHLRQAKPDGTTLLVSPSSVITMGPHLYRNTPYRAADFDPLLPVARLDLALYAGPGAPDNIRTVQDMVTWLRDNPGKRNCGMPGAGSTPHLAAQLIGQRTGLDWQLVPYQGDAPSFMALLGGEVPVSVSSLAGGMEHLRAGKLRLLALTGSERSTFVPDAPTLTEAGYDVVVEDRHTVFAPNGLDPQTRANLQAALAKALATPEVTELLARMSLQRPAPVADLPASLRAEDERWAALAKSLNLSFD